MRLMSALDWATFFESVSLVDETMCAGSDFASMDFASRDSYRHAIEEVARGSALSELEVARRALAHADSARTRAPDPAGARDARWTDPGFYLVGGGRREFEKAVGCRPTLRLQLRRMFIDVATPGYLITLGVITAAVLALPLALAARTGTPLSGLLILGVLALIPASDLAVAILHRICTTVVTPRLLPRLDWRSGGPTEFRTMVAVPTLLTGRADVDEQVERLEVHYLANADGDLRFALASDWNDATTEHADGDEEILAAARTGIAELNARHGKAADGGDRFFLFHRGRRWNGKEGRWMGWERKRGKLHELNRLLRGSTATTFMSTNGRPPEAPTGVRYVVTLDADTRLPMGAVTRLVGTMAHPLNRPRLDRARQRVVEGHAILQPRVTPPLPGRAGSVFQRLSSGSSGIDPYAAAVSDG